MLLMAVAKRNARVLMESDEIIIHCYRKPIRIMLDPGKNHPRYERDWLLGWICQGESRTPILKKYPDAKIVAKSKSYPNQANENAAEKSKWSDDFVPRNERNIYYLLSQI